MDPKQYVYTDQTWRRPSAPCTEVEIHRSLALLGINSWEELEQDTQDIGDIMSIKEKLDRALRLKLQNIDRQSQRETVEVWRVNTITKRLEKQIYERNVSEQAAVKQRSRIATKHKQELNEAYQLILREHHIRVKRRAKQKMLAISAITTISLVVPKFLGIPKSKDVPPDNLGNGSLPKYGAEDISRSNQGNLAALNMKDALSPMKDHNSGILAKINSITAISSKKIPKSPGTPRKRRHLSGTLSPVTPMKEHNSGILAKISSITAISSTKDAPKSPGSLRKSKSAANISSPSCRKKSTKCQRPITPTKSRL